MIDRSKRWEAVRSIALIERRRLTRNGNPRFLVTFTDGSHAMTKADSRIAYVIENSEYRDCELTITFDGSGCIVDAVPVA